jgi:hypothetical protein
MRLSSIENPSDIFEGLQCQTFPKSHAATKTSIAPPLGGKEDEVTASSDERILA